MGRARWVGPFGLRHWSVRDLSVYLAAQTCLNVAELELFGSRWRCPNKINTEWLAVFFLFVDGWLASIGKHNVICNMFGELECY
jgi:hypothetical protein